jgi:hypothetical protein
LLELEVVQDWEGDLLVRVVVYVSLEDACVYVPLGDTVSGDRVWADLQGKRTTERPAAIIAVCVALISCNSYEGKNTQTVEDVLCGK